MGFRDEGDEGDEEDTANIEFTAAFPRLGAGLRNAKPRRRRAADGVGLGFAIHEDKVGAGAGAGAGALMKAVRRNGIAEAGAGFGAGATASAIAQPPQRPKRGVNFAAPAGAVSAGEAVQQNSSAKASTSMDCTSRRLSQAPRRPVVKAENAHLVVAPLSPLPEQTFAVPTVDATTVLKPTAARRGTIYIPSEDTTMPSMYMGMFSPIKDLDAVKVGSMSAIAEDVEVTGIAAQMLAKKKRCGRKSMVAMSPKRGPLQLSSRNLQDSAVAEDRWGQGDGKENVPPGRAEVDDKKRNPGKRISVVEAQAARVQPQLQATRVSRLYESTASAKTKAIDKKTGQRTSAKPSWNAGPRLNTSQPVPVRTEPPGIRSDSVATHEYEVQATKPSIPTRFVMPRLGLQQRIREIYPVLSDDLADISMYEDSWLHHQEIAITQLINNLFGASTAVQSPIESEMLTVRLLERYGHAENAILYKRLQGALLYGTLCVPSEILKGAARLRTDLGKRKAYMDLWLETYDLSCLQSAVEVVVGRQCTKSRSSFSSRRSSDGQSVSRRALQGFIETFMIRNEDGTPEEPSADHAAWSYQRTLLRSLMLIKLLDSTKGPQGRVFSGCLFQPSSQYKSSVSVVKALFQLLNPSAGDPIRALSHVAYTVSHSQYPLEEYSYRIENIAVDLRDGVRLTRLVELLLYPSASTSLNHVNDADSTTTVVLPGGEQLLLTDGERDWPLSQHLKLPCHGRATKLYNAQVALSALHGVKGMATLVRDIRAEDIVDGYREKTVKLLWGLTSKWGLGGLIDWDDVQREIKRLCRIGNSSRDNDYYDLVEEGDDGYARHKVLLKSWAQAIASKKGIPVRNLTTSFADGRVFEAIVHEYEGYVASKDDSSAQNRTLSTRLRGLGCSEQFAMLFSTAPGSPNRTHLFDRDFVLAALAFLCSRLLGPTKGIRAAVTIQKAWRSYWARVLDARKVLTKAIAEDCAQSIRDRQRRIAEATDGPRTGPPAPAPPTSDMGQARVAAPGRDQNRAGLGSIDAGPAFPAMTDEEDIWLNI
jgi:abnormal spindle-like microcephaly-associated protein